ncbi:MAG: biotin carboxylase N-terminal domain-containing protein, partial [Longicatena sp.]
MIKRLLIANRGEIAVRIIRTCKEMGIETVAVYSTADHESLHVQLADYAVCIGGPKSNDSYLNMKNILSAACMTGCDAIHPGFGFLSENAKFARLVMQCGLIFIGPNPDVIDQMGDKNNARQKMMEAKVPVIPGSKDILQSVEEAKDMAESIGFPVLIKASNGGGGRGMRRVDAIEELENAYQSAKAEAKANFGDDAVYMEKFIIEPKHVEVQLLADKHGNVLHLFERDCSCQRRNQKLLEEAPCHILQDEIRQQLLSDAVKACKSVG